MREVPAGSVRTPRHRDVKRGTSSSEHRSPRHAKQPRHTTKSSATPSSQRLPRETAHSAPLQCVLNAATFFSNAVWQVACRVSFLWRLWRGAQYLIFRAFALLQWLNEFPLRMQFRRTTQRFLSVMNTTERYATFVDAAASLDHYCGVAKWAQEAPPFERCDAVGLLVDAAAAQQLVKNNQFGAMETFLCSLLKRNAHGMMDPTIYNYFHCPKYCVEDYTHSIEELIVAYAGTRGGNGDASVNLLESTHRSVGLRDGELSGDMASGAADPTTAITRAAPTQRAQLRTCWVRMDLFLHGASSDASVAAAAVSSPLAAVALPRTVAAATSTLATAAASANALPAVDIAAKIKHAWRHSATLVAQEEKQQRQQQRQQQQLQKSLASADLTPAIPQQSERSLQLDGTASPVAPDAATRAKTGTEWGKSVSSVLTSRRTPSVCFKSALGDESSYLAEGDLPSRPTVGGGAAKRVSASRNFESSRTEGGASVTGSPGQGVLPLPSPLTKARETELRAISSSSNLVSRSPARPTNEEDVLTAYVSASCASLHRFLDVPAATAGANAATSPSLPPRTHRLRVLRQVLHSFGRTALVLSGGSSMGTYHAGVARALYVADVLPNIMCGSSAGSIIAALICTKSPAELKPFMQSDVLSTEAVKLAPFGEDITFAEKLRRFFKTGFCMDVRTLMECMREQCGDLTFLEAYELSGKVLNVSVTRSQQEGTHADRHVLLNYVTAPDVVIWSAVSASCALPGLFTAVQLIERPPSAPGTFAPYLPGELWCDGSVAQDIPRRLLSQLFGVDYLIVSQVNPYVIPFLRPSTSYQVVSRGSSLIARPWFMWVSVWCWLLTVLFSLRLLPRTGAFEVIFLPFAQYYGGDVTIYPVESIMTAAPDYLNLMTNPSADYISYVASRAQCRTWPLVTRIRLAMAIERCLLRELHYLERAEYAKDGLS